MKSRDMSKGFRTRQVTNILYSAVITCLLEVFLVANVSMIVNYLEQTRYADGLLVRAYGADAIVILVYVLVGIGIFSVTFLMLEERSMRYISRISAAIQNISEGDLNTSVEVVGDDEFSAMAANLNKMVEDIRRLMDKEREAERTKNELITNVAHDLRTPLTSIISYIELMKTEPDLPPHMQDYRYRLHQGEAPGKAHRGSVRLHEDELRQAGDACGKGGHREAPKPASGGVLPQLCG